MDIICAIFVSNYTRGLRKHGYLKYTRRYRVYQHKGMCVSVFCHVRFCFEKKIILLLITVVFFRDMMLFMGICLLLEPCQKAPKTDDVDT